jgi:iron complex transport system ATP-binding protein
MSPLLELAHARIALRGRLAVDDVSLSVSPGEVVALLGPNGAGKTTLLRAALGFVSLSGGEVRLGGADPRKLSPLERARRTAYLPQRPQSIWPISVAHLVALGRFAYGASPDRLSPRDQAEVEAALEACALTPLRDRPMDEISGGEKARAHLARALAQHSALLLLDEPTAGLDPAQSLAVADIIRAHAGGGAVLFSTHDVALAARTANRIVLLREGRVLAEGPPEAALAPDKLEAAYGRKGRLERIGDGYAASFD